METQNVQFVILSVTMDIITHWPKRNKYGEKDIMNDEFGFDCQGRHRQVGNQCIKCGMYLMEVGKNIVKKYNI